MLSKNGMITWPVPHARACVHACVRRIRASLCPVRPACTHAHTHTHTRTPRTDLDCKDFAQQLDDAGAHMRREGGAAVADLPIARLPRRWLRPWATHGASGCPWATQGAGRPMGGYMVGIEVCHEARKRNAQHTPPVPLLRCKHARLIMIGYSGYSGLRVLRVIRHSGTQGTQGTQSNQGSGYSGYSGLRILGVIRHSGYSGLRVLRVLRVLRHPGYSGCNGLEARVLWPSAVPSLEQTAG
jgi:acetolactate synthase regulatory subunit